MNNLFQKKFTHILSATILFSLLLVLWLLLSYFDTDTISQISEHCTVPYPGKPLIRYAIMIDAGSSGSRIHIYKFNYCKEMPELENEIFHAIEPGLSAYRDDPLAGAGSFDRLLQLAIEHVPKELQKCTPIAVKATAGLRLLGQEASEGLLDAVREKLETMPFPIHAVEVMDAKEEGVFAWMTVNYLSGNLGGSTVAVFDLGGASTQVVFEPTGRMAPGDHVYELEIGKAKYTLYQHSYLGFGLNEARKRIKSFVTELWRESHSVYDHPCLPENYTETAGEFQLVGTGAGHAPCRGLIERVFEKDKRCVRQPCAFDGIYQPSLTESFPDRDLYMFSYFYDLTQLLGMPPEFSVREFGELANRVCEQDLEAFRHIPGAVQLIKGTPSYCLDLTYMHALLRIGYEIPSHRRIRTAKKIQGAETGWCLGASIVMMNDARLKCKY
ncbi:Putative Guanosine-diphosphatase [Rhizopus microsporus]|nr:Putative Guanosine-diphosphatase [Rhizopus microsporus]